ncbi:DUF4360 domain-containing protein [Kutzneria kofuensis]|uniref:DUF4360 domain-containing protein n=1 Tax=Kutzneria kofuensis TaxID=103725 RepID=A0A7W9KRN9_9PSEU|nr:DUF4360 domain-containing protein [Kutzneria kofuensis]MBB5897480.1 hypothetical protein [Kutzneria kofuensis]
MRGALAVAGLVLSLFTPVTDSQTSSPPPGKITLDIKTINGSGCPAGTADATAVVSPDNTAFTVTYNNFVARAGAGAAAVDQRKNCQINVLVHVPPGFTYAVAEADYSGFAHLAAGATALEQANYYFTGTAPTARVPHSLTGPFDGEWQTQDVADVLVYAPCGVDRNLNINAELRAGVGSSNSANGSYIEMDTSHASVSTVYQFAWKQC